jgi:hypothetical protein
MSCGEPPAVFKSTSTFTASVSGKRCEALLGLLEVPVAAASTSASDDERKQLETRDHVSSRPGHGLTRGRRQ